MRIKYLIIFLTITLSFDVAAYICNQTSILREEEYRVLTCGYGEASSKTDAEMKAYSNAIRVLETHCRASVECRYKKFSVIPMRVKCNKKDNGYGCTRMLDIILVSESNFKHETSLSFYSEMSFVGDQSFASPDLDLGISVNNQFKRVSFLLNVGYRFSSLKALAEDDLYKMEEYVDVDYRGVVYGAGIGFHMGEFEISLIQNRSTQRRNIDEGYDYYLTVYAPGSFSSTQTKAIFSKEITDNNRLGLTVSDYTNSLGVKTNSIGVIFNYGFD